MSYKTTAAVLTVILLILAAVVVVFAEVIAFNGYSEQQGLAGVAASLGCQGIGIVVCAALAARLSGWLVTTLNWNKALSVVLAIVAGALLGGGFAVISLVLAVAVAGGVR